MTPVDLTFHSVLAEAIGSYITAKRAVGCRFATEARGLRLLDRFLLAQGVTALDAITPAVIEAFLASRPRPDPKSANALLGIVRRFFDRLVTLQGITVSPVRVQARREGPRRLPFLFGIPEMRRLLALAQQLPDRNRGPRRGATYHAIFAVLYALGLRVGEVSRLQRADLDPDRQLLWIRNSKFGKSRLVPFGPRVGAMLRTYIESPSGPPDPSPQAPLFTFDGRHGVSTNAIRNAFRDHLLPQLHLAVPPGTRSPRVHDLRHSFAVGTLLRWYRRGVDPATRLPHLSTFLGHINPTATAVYLTITAELLQEAHRRFAAFAPPLPEVTS
jgi:integrase